jgi:hypothetical protein
MTTKGITTEERMVLLGIALTLEAHLPDGTVVGADYYGSDLFPLTDDKFLRIFEPMIHHLFSKLQESQANAPKG